MCRPEWVLYCLDVAPSSLHIAAQRNRVKLAASNNRLKLKICNVSVYEVYISVYIIPLYAL